MPRSPFSSVTGQAACSESIDESACATLSVAGSAWTSSLRAYATVIRSSRARAHIRDHQRNDDGIVARDLEDHDYGSERNANRTCECRAHPHQRIGPDAGGVIGHEPVGHAADRAPRHRPHKQAWTEDAAGIAGRIAGGDRDDFEDQQQDHQAEGHVAVQGVAYESVPDSEDLGDEPADDSD